jgi:hypothetical protein
MNELRIEHALRGDPPFATAYRPVPLVLDPTRFPPAPRLRSANRYLLPGAAALVVILAGVLLLPGLVTPPFGNESPSPSTDRSPAPTERATVPPASVAPRAAGFTPAGSLHDPRAEHFAVLLQDGTVLVGSGRGPLFPESFSSSESWNTTERWFAGRKAFDYSAELGTTSDVVFGGLTHVNQTAVRLPDSRVLVIPAGCFCSPPPRLHAELWSEADGTAHVRTFDAFESVRTGHSVTLLADGRILIAGGSTQVADKGSVGTAEIWDPVAATITPTDSMSFDRMNHAATLLRDGRVLVVGGVSAAPGPGDRRPVPRAEIWDPASGEFTVVPALQGIDGVAENITNYRSDGALRLVTLSDGRVLILDGSTARTWSPTSGVLDDAGAFPEPRSGYAATLLPTGQVLVVGGKAGEQALASAELWDPASSTLTPAGSLATARVAPTATLLPDGRVLVVGGLPGVPGSLPGNAELWEPGSAQ